LGNPYLLEIPPRRTHPNVAFLVGAQDYKSAANIGSDIRYICKFPREGASAFIAPESQAQVIWFSILGASPAMEPAKTRKWSEEESNLLIELAHRKERVPVIAKELGRHIASVKRRARELGLLLPQGRGERPL
jgi:hypothetical protein